jgi:hypothetical protein
VVFVESLGEGEGGLPGLFDLDARFDLLETLHVLLVGEDLGQGMSTFIFWETTLLGSASCHISKLMISI